jgi:hypothetical protein
MFDFYGDGGLRVAIELPLGNPVARRTRVAFAGLESAAELPDDATISYLRPISRAQVDIRRNAQCSDGASASGWNREGNLVRLCGDGCENLREALSEVAGVHAQSLHVAPAVPLVVTAPCP